MNEKRVSHYKKITLSSGSLCRPVAAIPGWDCVRNTPVFYVALVLIYGGGDIKMAMIGKFITYFNV